jgi:hypothetical protein
MSRRCWGSLRRTLGSHQPERRGFRATWDPRLGPIFYARFVGPKDDMQGITERLSFADSGEGPGVEALHVEQDNNGCGGCRHLS